MKQSLPASLNTKLVRHHRTGEINLCETIYSSMLIQPRHTHKNASFSYVLKGNYAETLYHATYSRQASTVVFHPPDESHAVKFESDVRILSVEFSFERLAKIRRHSVIFDDPASCRSEVTNFLGNKIYREFCLMDSFSMLAIEGLILELLAEASRFTAPVSEKSIPRWLVETKEFLHDNFVESFTLEKLAKIAGVHPVYLSRQFRAKFGCTVGEYVRRLRVEYASRQIASTDAPLSEIAHAAGFADQSHLNKTFKTACGMTPAEYRKLRKLN